MINSLIWILIDMIFMIENHIEYKKSNKWYNCFFVIVFYYRFVVYCFDIAKVGRFSSSRNKRVVFLFELLRQWPILATIQRTMC